MNGNSKHKPLSSEELFRMLEAKDEHAFPGGELDDFEKDALEGFSAHVSAEQARKLTEELQGLIHEKVQEQKATRPAAKLIWLSAAASVILILILSVYFLTQSAAPISPDLALNKEPAHAEAYNQLPPEDTKAISTLEEQPQLAPGVKLRDPAGEQAASNAEQETATYEESTVNRTAPVVEDAKRKDDQAAASKAEEQHSKGSYDKAMAEKYSETDLKTVSAENQMVSADYERMEKKDQAAGIPEYKNMQKEQPAPTYVAESMYGLVMQKLPAKNKASAAGSGKRVVVSDAAVATPEESKPPAPENRKASFPGGNPAIKSYVLDWMKKQGVDVQGLKGTYHVKLKVLASGTTAVAEIKKEQQADTTTTNVLENALNEMQNWSPAYKGGKEVDSELDLNLSF